MDVHVTVWKLITLEISATHQFPVISQISNVQELKSLGLKHLTIVNAIVLLHNVKADKYWKRIARVVVLM